MNHEPHESMLYAREVFAIQGAIFEVTPTLTEDDSLDRRLLAGIFAPPHTAGER
jgi:hypothetical protein